MLMTSFDCTTYFIVKELMVLTTRIILINTDDLTTAATTFIESLKRNKCSELTSSLTLFLVSYRDPDVLETLCC